MMKAIGNIKSKQLVLYLVLLAIVIFLMMSLKRCHDLGSTAAADSPHASGGDTLDVAIEYSPTFYYTYDDTLGGFCFDLMTELSRLHGRPMKFHPIATLATALNMLDNGTYDMVIAQFPVTRENKAKYLFTEALYLDRQVLVQRRRADGSLAVSSQLDLAGDTVVVVKGSPMDERIASLSREIGDTIHIKREATYGSEQLLIMVATGEIRYAVVNESIARRMAQRYPSLDVSTEISFSQFQSITLKKGNQALCDTLDRWLIDAKKHPFYTSLTRRYLELPAEQ